MTNTAGLRAVRAMPPLQANARDELQGLQRAFGGSHCEKKPLLVVITAGTPRGAAKGPMLVN